MGVLEKPIPFAFTLTKTFKKCSTLSTKEHNPFHLQKQKKLSNVLNARIFPINTNTIHKKIQKMFNF